MSGHNKWSKIKHKKAATDGQKSKIFSKLVRFITVEAKKANGDINSPGLRLAIEKARKENMPNDNIDRAIKKATEPGAAMEAGMYEGYGPGGAGIIVETLTDSKNRAAQEIKHIFSKNNGALGAMGSVAWAFQKQDSEWIPTTTVELSDEDIEKLSNLVEELEDNDEVQNVYTNAS